MGSKLVFNKIKKERIFHSDFENFNNNNEIEFKKLDETSIAILYGPNGTGKTSIARLLASEVFDDNNSFEVAFEGKLYKDNNLFHVINDQNSRNVIEGSTEDYLLGDNIKKEFELKKYIDAEFNRVFKTSLPSQLKVEFNITSMKSKLINHIQDEDIKGYVSDLVNSKSKGDKINKDEFLKKVGSILYKEIQLSDEEKIKFDFVKNNYADDKSIINKIMSINNSEIKKNESIREIEENDEALKILDKFHYKSDCVVCDNTNISRETLINRKKLNREKVFEALDDETRKILNEIVYLIKMQLKDPLNIENILIDAIKEGNKAIVKELQDEINKYIDTFNIVVINFFANCLLGSDLIKKYQEYKALLLEQPEITEEEMLFIEKIVSENIEKPIVIKRDESNENNLKILLGDQEFLGVDREKLHLSNGEQNFISLAFELLKAKKSDKKIIILDDPISSFDSIYKNKIAFCIIKFLERKNQLILTHNTDLIRLLEYQLQGCFNLYLFNNVDEGVNGFIKVDKKEQDIMLNLNRLLELFRESIFEKIKDEKKFLISMIPFMRGYANIIGERDIYKGLSKLMHGYEREKVDITEIYNYLFCKNEDKIKNQYKISVEDILGINIDKMDILDINEYPLLNNTLYHTLTYLFLRLQVEKTLVELYNIEIKGFALLHNIIRGAFKPLPTDSLITRKEKTINRIFFTSRKTLLNEFNHFEGNMNIFQPAIDITDTSLKKEKQSIINYLEKLRQKQAALLAELC